MNLVTKYDYIVLARKGIETSLKEQCNSIAETSVNQNNVDKLKKLIIQYDEVIAEYDKAKSERKSNWDE